MIIRSTFVLKVLVLILTVIALSAAISVRNVQRLKPGKLGLARGPVRYALTKFHSLTQPAPSARQADVASLVAYGLASLPFLALPLLFMAPLAYARMAPLLYNLNEAIKQIEEPSSPLNDALQTLGLAGSSSSSSSSSSNSESSSSSTSASSSASSLFTQLATQKFAQALGLPLSNGIQQSAAAASALGEAIFSPGVFSPLGSGHKYNFKEPAIFQQLNKKKQQR